MMNDNILPRFGKAIDLIERFNIKAYTFLDLGCGDGGLSMEIAKIVGAKEVYCVDIDVEALRRASLRNIKTFALDISKDIIPFPNNSVDLVTALEVIEHLINPDNMLRETYRVLKPSGYFLISTPNLASWVNGVLLLLGYQPYNCEASTEVLAGVLWRGRTFAKPAGHIRAFTLRALKELLKYHGFKIINVKGAPGVEPKELRYIDALLSSIPSLARRLIVLAQKV